MCKRLLGRHKKFVLQGLSFECNFIFLCQQGAKNKKRDNSFFKSWKLPKIGRNRLQQPQPPLQQQQQQHLPLGPGARGNRPDFRFSTGNEGIDEQGPSNASVLVRQSAFVSFSNTGLETLFGSKTLFRSPTPVNFPNKQ